jgi:hypothetical protein
MNRSIFVGYDGRETESFAVCRHTLRQFAPDIPVHAISLDDMRGAGLYWRPTSTRDGRLWDDISEAPMSTEFAISRFLTPILAKSAFRTGWALFMDCDVLARTDVHALFDELDQRDAVACVQHRFAPPEGLKMDGQLQVQYARKAWSSVVAYNLDHASNRKLTVDLVNRVPGRDLHAFCWLRDEEIGELAPRWNYLVGHTETDAPPALVHFTSGGPWLDAYRDVPYADEWRAARAAWLNDGVTAAPTHKARASVPSSPALRVVRR